MRQSETVVLRNWSVKEYEGSGSIVSVVRMDDPVPVLCLTSVTPSEKTLVDLRSRFLVVSLVDWDHNWHSSSFLWFDSRGWSRRSIETNLGQRGDLSRCFPLLIRLAAKHSRWSPCLLRGDGGVEKTIGVLKSGRRTEGYTPVFIRHPSRFRPLCGMSQIMDETECLVQFNLYYVLVRQNRMGLRSSFLNRFRQSSSILSWYNGNKSLRSSLPPHKISINIDTFTPSV